MLTRRRVAWILGAGVGLLGAVGVAIAARRLALRRHPPAPESSVATPAGGLALRIGAPERVFAASVFVADARGLFRDRGVSVAIVPYPDGRAALRGLRAGEVDVAVAGDLPAARMALDVPELTVVARLGRSLEDRWVVARPGAQIATSADLRGKRIATQVTTGSHYVLTRVLAEKGIAESDVTVRDLSIDAAPRALSRGEVDALTTEHPFQGKASKHYGFDVVELHDPTAYVLTYDLVAMRRPTEPVEALTRAMGALADADHLLRSEPEAMLDVLAARLQKPRDAVEKGMAGFTEDLGLDGALSAVLDREARWFVERGAPNARAPGQSLVDPGPLRAARPELVRSE